MEITIAEKLNPKTLLNLDKVAAKNKEKIRKIEGKNNIVKLKEDNQIFRKFPPILFKYQQDFIKAAEDEKYKCLVWEKSRRIGATHGLAAFAVLEASKKGGKNFFYIGLNLGMAREFIDSCAYWARHFNFAATKIKEVILKDEKQDIQVLKITFKSGKKIEALSSKPSSIRGRQGHICLDESAFLEESLDEFLKATLSMQIWGSKVFVISTHDGIENPFNILCESIRKGEKPYYLQRTTFKEAVSQGLYERICLMTSKTWDLEEQKAWLEDIYHQYGDAATEELDAIPKIDNPNAVFKREYFNKIKKEDLPTSFDVIGRFWDFASTNKDTSFYSVGTLLGVKGDKKYIIDCKYCRLNPGASDDFYLEVTKKDGKKILSLFELEGGSMALRYTHYLKQTLKGFMVRECKPEGSKILRSLPVKESAKKGEYFIVEADWTDTYLTNICRFDGSKVPLVTDLADSLSGAHENLSRKINHLLTS